LGDLSAATFVENKEVGTSGSHRISKCMFVRDTKQEKKTSSIEVFQSNISSKMRTSCCEGDDVISTSSVPEVAKESCEIAGTKSKAVPPSFDCVGDSVAVERVAVDAAFAAAVAAAFAASFAVTIVPTFSIDVQRLSSEGRMLKNEGDILANEGNQASWFDLAHARNETSLIVDHESNISSKMRTSCCEGDDMIVLSPVSIFGKEMHEIANEKEKEKECTSTLVCEGALSNAPGTSSEGVILAIEGDQVVIWSDITCAVRARERHVHGVRARDGDDKAARTRNGYYEAARSRDYKSKEVRAVPTRDSKFDAVRGRGGDEKAAFARDNDCSDVHTRDGGSKTARVRDSFYIAARARKGVSKPARAVRAGDGEFNAIRIRGGKGEAARARDDDCSGVHGRNDRSKATRVRDGCYEDARGHGSDTEFVRAVNACVVPARAQDGDEEAARAPSDDGARVKRNEEAARARVAMAVPPTTNPTTYPTGLPTNRGKVHDVPTSNKMKLPSFAREYENITSLLDTRLEKDRIFTKLGNALFSRTRHCYKFRKLRELPEHVMLNSGIGEFTQVSFPRECENMPYLREFSVLISKGF
jgi:hypothetical protein